MGRWTRVVVAAAALAGGFAGSAAAVRLSDYPGPPPVPAAVAAATAAIGRPPADRPGPVVECDFWCPEYDGDGVVAYDAPADRTDVVTVTYVLSQTRAADVEAAARQRLAAAGWRDAGDGRLARAGRTLDLHVDDTYRGAQATFVTAKAFSAAALALAVAGFLVGAAAGAAVAAAAARRHRRHGPTPRGVTGTIAGLFVLVTAVYTAQTALYAHRLSAEGRWQPRDVQLAEFVLTVLPPVPIAVATAVLAALALLALPPGRPVATLP